MTAHAAVATILGRNINSTLLAFVIGMISHFVFDMIPHGDEKLGKKFFGHKLRILKQQGELKFLALYGSIDAFFLAIFLIFLFKNFNFANSNAVIASIIGAILPDIITAFYKLTNSRFIKWFHKLHTMNHKFIVEKLNWDFPLKYGVLMQLIFLSILIWVIGAG